MITKLVLKQILESQKERIDSLNTGLQRNVYNYQNIGSNAYILTGVRRCGKSTVLQQINKSNEFNSMYINFEDPRLSSFNMDDFNRLHEIALENNITAFFLDETQIIEKWENFVRFRVDEGYKIFITGSKASMLSRELGTKLAGRHISKELFPFSYGEYLDFKTKTKNKDTQTEYMTGGGFPEFIKTGNEEILMHTFSDIVIRDIAVRYNIKNVLTLKQLAVWIVSNIGKPITGNSLKKIFNIGSSSSIMEYLSFFSDAYLFFFVPKFSYSIKNQIVNPKKAYCIDNGFITTNSVSFSEDNGRLLENMVFLHIRHKTKEIYYFNEKKECDFVVFENAKIKYVCQVCWELNESNTDREIGGLLEAMEFFNLSIAEIITYNQSDSFHIDGKTIKVIPFYAWVN
ncbi:MAG TPA: ATP-binding protein [Bacteroidales bacterium]|nr:ATP-binding protein [Bacteroidales bacterium]